MLREALTLDRLNAMPPDEAAAWFVAQRGEGLAAQEQALLDRWLAADQVHGRAYGRAARAWDAFAGSQDDEILAAMRAHALAPRAVSRVRWPRVAAAAAALLAVALALALQFGRGPASRAEALRYVARHEIEVIRLPDGSTMTLDAGSMAVARFSEDERALDLARGRALFAVRPDGARPFAVSAGTRRVVALGTEFEVDRAPSRLSVTLFEGKITVEPIAGGPGVTLAPGDQFVETGGALFVHRGEQAVGEPAGWRSGLLDFDDRPLADAVAEVNRYTSEPIVIGDPAVGAMRISGQFRAGDAERFARTVAEVHPLRVVRRDGRIELVSAH